MEHRASAEQPWVPFSTGTSIGNKRIDLAAASVQVAAGAEGAALRLVVAEAAADPVVVNFAAFSPCATA